MALARVTAPLDVVVWNPGAARAKMIADLGEDDWKCVAHAIASIPFDVTHASRVECGCHIHTSPSFRHYVCIEPGRVSPATAEFAPHAALHSGQQWTLTQEISLLCEAGQ